MMQSPIAPESKVRVLLKISLFLFGPFIFGCALVLLGLSAYIGLAQPKRLAAVVPPNQTNIVIILSPQPEHVSVKQTNIIVVAPPIEAYFTGAATNAAVWAHGKGFKSGARAGGELLSRAWVLWCVCSAVLICLVFVRRWRLKQTGMLDICDEKAGGPVSESPRVRSE